MAARRKTPDLTAHLCIRKGRTVGRRSRAEVVVLGPDDRLPRNLVSVQSWPFEIPTEEADPEDG